MSLDSARWEKAIALHRTHGAVSPQVVAERISELPADADDHLTMQWQAIAWRVDHLIAGNVP